MLYPSLICLFLLVEPAIAGIAFPRRLSTGWHFLLLGICIPYGIFSFLITWGAPSLAKSFGCSAEAMIRVVTVVLALIIPASVALYFWCCLVFLFEPLSQQPIGEQS
jgi:hypothetical protein